MIKREIVSGHAIRRRHCAQRQDVLIGPLIAHHTDRINRQQDGKSLPNLIVQIGFVQLFEIDRVRFAQCVGFVAGNLARNANGEARPWERMVRSSGLGWG